MKEYNFDKIIDRQHTNCLKWDNRSEFFGTDEVIPLWVADMDFRTPDFIINALRKRLDHEILGYHFHPISFYEAIQQWVLQRSGWEIHPIEMAFSPGIVPAINFAVKAFTVPGDKILINRPVYHPFIYAINDHGRQLINSPLVEKEGFYNIDFDDFEEKIADGVKMYMLCSPHNPVGRVWSLKELSRIGELCVKYNVVLVSDEIHSDLIIKSNKHIPIASISEAIAQQTLTFLAPSKTFNLAGVFTSIVHSKNMAIIDTFKQYVDKMHLGSGNVFGDVALEAAYRNGAEWLEQLLDYIERNFDFVINFLKEYIPAIKTKKPESTYLMWLDCRELGMSATELDHFMIKKAGLALNSGTIFGEEGSGFMRLNVATPRSILEKAMKQLYESLNR